MMEPQSGTFKDIGEELAALEKESRELSGIEARADVLLKKLEAREGKPTIYVGEVVEIKGVKFQVQRIRAIGVLVLRMVPGQR